MSWWKSEDTKKIWKIEVLCTAQESAVSANESERRHAHRPTSRLQSTRSQFTETECRHLNWCISFPFTNRTLGHYACFKVYRVDTTRSGRVMAAILYPGCCVDVLSCQNVSKCTSNSHVTAYKSFRHCKQNHASKNNTLMRTTGSKMRKSTAWYDLVCLSISLICDLALTAYWNSRFCIKICMGCNHFINYTGWFNTLLFSHFDII